MHRQGSSILAAVPLWSEFMNQALKTISPDGFPRPDPWGSEKPVIRGQYLIDNQIHSILYYVDKNDPAGPPPQYPANDPQFQNWETGVSGWVAQNPSLLTSAPSVSSAQTSPSSPAPASSAGPNIQFSSPQNGSFAGNTVELAANLSSGSSLVEADVYWNQVLIYTKPLSGNSSFLDWAFSPSSAEQQNSLEIEVKDSSGKTFRSGIILYKQS